MKRAIIISVFASLLASTSTMSQSNDTIIEKPTFFDLSLEQLLGINVDQKFKLYGFINSNVEKVFKEPSIGTTGKTQYQDAPLEWSSVKNFHVYGSGKLNDKIDILFNLAKNGNGIEVRNAWGNIALNDHLQIRAGKMYRPFGLYNEKLDQIPTFTGIEAPELFDTDHLFITRTTDFMVHGTYKDFRYSLTTDNGEGGPIADVRPLGWDLRYKSSDKGIIIGTSGYTSSITNTKSTSTVSLGDGSPKGGILPWMAGDHFIVLGGFIEKSLGKFLIQSEYWVANHDALRDPTSTLAVIQSAGINERQRKNFLGDNASKSDANLTESDIVTSANYLAQTFYVRLSYNIENAQGKQFVPYIFFDWMSNPEVIQSKSYGGDNESGLADDGKFIKPSLGIMYRPIKNVAIKLDGSYHQQRFNGATERYPEVRLDFSYTFDALKNYF